MTEEQQILVVEDSEPLRRVLAEKLREERFEVLEASGGEEGIRIARESKPDMIITDIVMFPMDGLEMVRQIRSEGTWGANLRVIALSNQNSSEDEKRIEALDLTAYMVKAETSLDEVVKRVKEILKKKK
jgi:DNA-binding response OmpR family regulator